MASTDYGQVTVIVQRLGDLASLLNPVKLVSVIGQVVHEIATPPPGDPEALDSLAAAHLAAARAIAPVAADVRKLGAEAIPEAWKGGAATDATEVLKATSRAVDRTPAAFTDAADALTELAGAVRRQQARHAELHQRLREAAHDATHVAGLPLPDPVGIGRLVAVTAELIAGCRHVYTQSLDSADRAAGAFADLRGRARAAAAVDKGLAPDDAVVLTDKMVRVLADGYDDGVLTAAQLAKATDRMGALDQRDRARFDGLLAAAGSDTERAWLLKALAAGHGLDALGAFAEKVNGKDPAWLDQHLSLIDRGAEGRQDRLGEVVRQYEDTTCGTTSLIVARAERDPLYALSLTEGDFAENFKAERDRVHDTTNLVYPEAIGTSPVGMTAYLNEHSDTEYTWHLVDDTDHRDISATLREVVTAAGEGTPVPLLVGGAIPRHYVLVVGHDNGSVLVFEPTAGRTIAVPERDFLAGRLGADGLGFDHLQAVVVPSRQLRAGSRSRRAAGRSGRSRRRGPGAAAGAGRRGR